MEAHGDGRLAAKAQIALEHMVRARLCKNFPELAFEQRRFAGFCVCGAERWTSMEMEVAGWAVVVEVDAGGCGCRCGCGGLGPLRGPSGGCGGGPRGERSAGLLESAGAVRAVVRLKLQGLGGAETERTLEMAEVALERLEGATWAAEGPVAAEAGEIEVVEVGCVGSAQGAGR